MMDPVDEYINSIKPFFTQEELDREEEKLRLHYDVIVPAREEQLRRELAADAFVDPRRWKVPEPIGDYVIENALTDMDLADASATPPRRPAPYAAPYSGVVRRGERRLACQCTRRWARGSCIVEWDKAHKGDGSSVVTVTGAGGCCLFDIVAGLPDAAEISYKAPRRKFRDKRAEAALKALLLSAVGGAK